VSPQRAEASDYEYSQFPGDGSSLAARREVLQPRIRALIRKEVWHIMRDWQTLLIVLAMRCS